MNLRTNSSFFSPISSVNWLSFIPKRYGPKANSTVWFRLIFVFQGWNLVLAYICVQCDKEAVEIRYAEMQGDEGRKQ